MQRRRYEVEDFRDCDLLLVFLVFHPTEIFQVHFRLPIVVGDRAPASGATIPLVLRRGSSPYSTLRGPGVTHSTVVLLYPGLHVLVLRTGTGRTLAQCTLA